MRERSLPKSIVGNDDIVILMQGQLTPDRHNGVPSRRAQWTLGRQDMFESMVRIVYGILSKN